MADLSFIDTAPLLIRCLSPPQFCVGIIRNRKKKNKLCLCRELYRISRNSSLFLLTPLSILVIAQLL